MKLLIVIPALNEESSIQNIIERSLAARKTIVANSSVTEVEICVVSDGSTDGTVEIASRYANRIRLIVFPHNRGYGAAIKEAWKNTDAELLAFLDADGTCDPLFFANLCRALVAEPADIALGCRLNKESKMPLVRRIGNLFFSSLLTIIAHRRVRDTASGMRVLRREAYNILRPLPDGLHFTPAMSARALLGAGGGLKIVEIDMPYFERQGRSKLNVIRDGFRFLDTIFQAVFLYHPDRPLGYAAALCLILACVLTTASAAHYFAIGRFDERATVQLILGQAAVSASLLLGPLALLLRQVARVVSGMPPSSSSRLQRAVERGFASAYFWLLPALAAAGGAALLNSRTWTLAGRDLPNDSLPQILVALLLLLLAVVLAGARVAGYFLAVLARHAEYARREQPINTEQPADVCLI